MSTPPPQRPGLDVDALERGVRAGDRVALGRAITLVESNRRAHLPLAQELVRRLLPHAGAAHRVGVTGVPGVGKSTFIDRMGARLVAAGRRVAVLAVDPSSQLSGGSILGDKTRMARLAAEDNAFVRPSPSGGSLGGVARKSRESMILCEAAGYDVILVETVGVGQSETLVSEMVDVFVVLMLPGAGDELQGIKRGILELADLIAVNKADGDNQIRAEQARRDYAMALHLMRPASPHWTPPVLTCSAREDQGLAELWEQIEAHREALTAAGELSEKRRRQLVRWMWSLVEDHVRTTLRAHDTVPGLEADLLAGRITPTLAAATLLEAVGLVEND